MGSKKKTKPAMPVNFVASLLDAMKPGREYESIVSLAMPDGKLVEEQRKALAAIERIRGNPCACYIWNPARPSERSSIRTEDDLPFNELIASIDSSVKEIDFILATGGGLIAQAVHFVETLRNRFERVNFLLPSGAMSAGTIFVLSGDSIVMDERAYLGPIDPQVPTKDGYVPAQSILGLIKEIQNSGDEAIKNGNNPPWTMIRLLDNMDHRQIGVALSQTQYAEQVATLFLENYKFRHWEKHGKTGAVVSKEEKSCRALEIAKLLASNEEWKLHGHAISREAVETRLRLKIIRAEEIDGLSQALRKFWALNYYIFDKSESAKIFLSQGYLLVFNQMQL